MGDSPQQRRGITERKIMFPGEILEFLANYSACQTRQQASEPVPLGFNRRFDPLQLLGKVAQLPLPILTGAEIGHHPA